MSFIRAVKYYSLEYPFYFYSLAIAFTGPVIVLTVPPFRRKFMGYQKPADIPATYPIPNHSRRHPFGYED